MFKIINIFAIIYCFIDLTISINHGKINQNYQSIDYTLYFCGGRNDTSVKSECNKYDTKTNVWLPIQSMSKERRHFELIEYNGNLFTIGGEDYNEDLDIVESYDPKINTWTKNNPLNIKRNGLGVAVANDTIYSCGGYAKKSDQTLNVCEVYSVLTKVWRLSAPMIEQRSYFALVAHEGYLYAIGGQNEHGPLDSVESYDTRANKWQPVANMNEKRIQFSGVSFMGKIIVCGNYPHSNTCESYDPLTNKWTLIASMINYRCCFHLIAYNDNLLTVGGAKTGTHLIESYDFITNEWHNSISWPYDVWDFGATLFGKFD